MKKLKVKQMEYLNGQGNCTNTIRNGSRDFTTRDACIICSGLAGGVAGAFGGPASALTGYVGGLVWGMIDC